MTDGCKLHALSERTVESRWQSFNAMVEAAIYGLSGVLLKDEFRAQTAAAVVCHCCGGPAKDAHAGTTDAVCLCPSCERWALTRQV